MQNWKLFEQEACDYLRSSFKNYPFTFECEGGSDSTTSDIGVYKKGIPIFSIEAKLSPAQSGQFVLIQKETVNGFKFEYSRDNRFQDDRYSKQIIQYLNRNPSKYSTIKQSGLDISCPRELLIGWITEHYKSKQSKFVITAKSLNSYKAIIPLEDFGQWFDVSACLRRKKSGSRDVPSYEFDLAKQNSRRFFEEDLGHKITNFEDDGKRLSLNLSSNVSLKRKERYLSDSMYLSKDSSSSNRYVVRKLGTTNNVNVVFSVNFKGNSARGLGELENELKKHM